MNDLPQDQPLPEYKILHAQKIADLTSQVNAALQEGWTPLGGVTFMLTDPKMPTSHQCAQALTRNLNPSPVNPA